MSSMTFWSVEFQKTDSLELIVMHAGTPALFLFLVSAGVFAPVAVRGG